MEDARHNELKIGDVVTISRHHKTGESRPEKAIVIRISDKGDRARVHIQDGPDQDRVFWVTSRNVWKS